MRLILIDDGGELRSDRSEVVQNSFASLHSPDSIADYLVKNLGFVALNFYGASCQVRLRPAILTQKTFETLLSWLGEHPYERIALTYFDRDWKLELHGQVEVFGHRVMQLVDALQLNRPSDFLSAAQPLKQVVNTPTLQAVLDNWDALGRNLGARTVSRLLNRVTDGRYVIARHRSESDKFEMHAMGPGYVSISNRWVNECRGQPVDAQHDQDYGRFVIDAYRKSMLSPEPCVDDVDAILSTRELGRYRVRYRRLLLSRPGLNGDTWIISSSVLDPGIDLRLNKLAVG